MKKYRIIADPRVSEDLQEAIEYLNAKRKGYGKKFINEYRKTLIHLQKNPFYQVHYQEIHCLPMKTFKYMIHFQINENERIVHVYAVLSTYLDPKTHFIKS
jgi:hypothetical protein